jgi:serine/threonine protein kinase
MKFLLSFRILEQVSITICKLYTPKAPIDTKLAFTPAALRAPEIVLQSDIDHKIDIWSFGCLFYELLTGKRLFQVSGLSDVPQQENDDNHLLQMIDTLGQASSEMFAKWSRRTRYFDKDLKLIRSDVGSSDITEREPYQGPSLEEAFEESRPDGMGVEECIHVLGLLRRLLQYEPALRPSTAELLEDKWFQPIT